MAAEPGRLRAAMAKAGTVRVRTTAAAVAVVGFALLLASGVLLAVLQGTLTREVRSATQLSASTIAAALVDDPTPALPDTDGQVVQILDQDGRVVAASPALAGAPPIATLRPGEQAEVRLAIDDAPFLAVADAADTARGRFTVLAAGTLDDATEPIRVLTGALFVGVPLLLVVVGLTTWTVVGRALRPVEDIRTEVDGISAAQLHRRVSTPAGDDEIARLAGTMNRMLDRLERAQVRQRRFVADASHELRSPLATIRQHTEVALAHPDRMGVTDLAGTILAEELRMQRLVDDLLLLARADEHSLALRMRSVDLDDVAFAEAARLRALAPTLRVDTSAVSAGRVLGDAAGLGRVLCNLGDNAVRHAVHRVAFTVRQHGDHVVLTVVDDGPGIPEPDRERVFERFVRLDAARAAADGGAGLGLAIVAELVAAHGGTVTIGAGTIGALAGAGEGADVGAAVTVTLPVSDAG